MKSAVFRLPRFYPILDTAVLAAHNCEVVETAKVLIQSGAKILQYRHKASWSQAEYDQANQISELCRTADVDFVLNDRADYAQLLGSALHIGQDDLPPVASRKIVPDAVIGFSTHNRRQLARADEEPVQYLSLGPIFSTTSKLNPDLVVTVDGLRSLRSLTKKPLVAIGGITLENAADVLRAGADTVAIISGFLPDNGGPSEIEKQIRAWLELIG